MDRPSPRGAYSTREVSALLGLSQAQVRSCVRAGFVVPQAGPRGELLFSFQDLVLLRTAKGLLAARIPRRRIRVALQKLHAQLPQGQPLTAVRISAQGHHVVARDGGDAWHPESGQTLLDFEVADLAREAAALEPRRLPPAAAATAADADAEPAAPPARSAPSLFRGAPGIPPAVAPPTFTPPAAAHPAHPAHPANSAAAELYEQGIELEEEDPAAAATAYRSALELAPGLADAHLNLGRLLHAAGNATSAEAHYRQALAARPDDALAAYNLGVALQDQHRLAEAAAAYRQALTHNPALADAHFNLSGVYEALGDKTAAFRHLRTYHTLSGNGA
jgi:tetratricopeptide (TPR) repeat protein